MTKEIYSKELIASEVILPSQNLLVISAASVNKVATLSEHSRAAFIEMFTGSKEIAKAYEQLSLLINDSKIEVDASVKEQKELMVEKKKLKKDIESTEKRSQLMDELKFQTKELDLFKMYHNGKFLDSVFDEAAELEAKLEELQAQKTENFNQLETNKQAKSDLFFRRLEHKVFIAKKIVGFQRIEESFQHSKSKTLSSL